MANKLGLGGKCRGNSLAKQKKGILIKVDCGIQNQKIDSDQQIVSIEFGIQNCKIFLVQY